MIKKSERRRTGRSGNKESEEIGNREKLGNEESEEQGNMEM